MEERDYRVLIQYRLGRSWRNASDEAKAKIDKEMKELVAKWEAEGSRLLCDFYAQGDSVAGYPHNSIWSIPDPETGYQMSGNLWNSEAAKHYERINVVVGWGWSKLPPE